MRKFDPLPLDKSQYTFDEVVVKVSNFKMYLSVFN